MAAEAVTAAMKRQMTVYAGKEKDAGKDEPFALRMECTVVRLLWKSVWRILRKLRMTIRLSYAPPGNIRDGPQVSAPQRATHPCLSLR